MVAAPDICCEAGDVSRCQSLCDHNVIVTDAVLSRQGTLTLCRGERATEVSIKPMLRTNNAQVLISSLKAGHGVGPVQLPLVIEELRSGALMRVLPQYEVKPSELYITYPTARFMRPTVRAFVDFVSPALKSVEGIV